MQASGVAGAASGALILGLDCPPTQRVHVLCMDAKFASRAITGSLLIPASSNPGGGLADCMLGLGKRGRQGVSMGCAGPRANPGDHSQSYASKWIRRMTPLVGRRPLVSTRRFGSQSDVLPPCRERSSVRALPTLVPWSAGARRALRAYASGRQQRVAGARPRTCHVLCTLRVCIRARSRPSRLSFHGPCRIVCCVLRWSNARGICDTSAPRRRARDRSGCAPLALRRLHIRLFGSSTNAARSICTSINSLRVAEQTPFKVISPSRKVANLHV